MRVDSCQGGGTVETGAFLQLAGDGLEAGDKQKHGEAEITPDVDGDDDEDIERGRAEPAVLRAVEADGAQEDVDDAQGRVEKEVEEYADDNQRDHKGNEENRAEQPGEARSGLKDDGEDERDSDLENEAADDEEETVAQGSPEKLVPGHLNEIIERR